MVMNSSATIRAERIREDLATLSLSREAFHFPGDKLKIFGMDAHP